MHAKWISFRNGIAKLGEMEVEDTWTRREM